VSCNRSSRVLTLAGVAIVFLAAKCGVSNAAVVVQDTFTGTPVAGNGAIVGRTPDTVNTAGNTYTEQQNNPCCAKLQLDNSTGNPSFSLSTGFNNSAHILYSNSGVPTTPITLSIDAQINNIQDESPAGGGHPRGIGLGFYNPLPTLFPGTEPSAHTNFTGIVVNPAGTLEYVRGGTSQGIFTAPPGGFSPSNFLTLSYTVDPIAGTITDLDYAGVDYLADFTTTFAVPGFTASDKAGLFGSTANNANLFGRVDNFVVDAEAPAGGPTVTITSTSSTGVFPVANDDLIEGLLPTIVGGIEDRESLNSDTSGAALTNGTFGPAGLTAAPGPNPELTIVDNNLELTYDLSDPADISDINVYSGWRDGGRVDQDYEVLYATSSVPVFQSLTTVSVDHTAGDPPGLGVFIAADGLTDVTAIRFVFTGVQNGYVGYKEIDVIGPAAVVPEPGTFVLAALGLVGLAFFGRRRRQRP